MAHRKPGRIALQRGHDFNVLASNVSFEELLKSRNISQRWLRRLSYWLGYHRAIGYLEACKTGYYGPKRQYEALTRFYETPGRIQRTKVL